MNNKQTIHEWYSQLGKRARAKQLEQSTPQERTDRARLAAKARWAKVRAAAVKPEDAQ